MADAKPPQTGYWGYGTRGWCTSPVKFGTCGEKGWKDAYRGIPRQRYDAGDCALLIRHYYHRTADDREGLTFLQEVRPGEKLVVNSSELRAVQGRQECDFKLVLPQPPPQKRQQLARAKKRAANEAPPQFDPKQRLRLAHNLDQDTLVRSVRLHNSAFLKTA